MMNVVILVLVAIVLIALFTDALDAQKQWLADKLAHSAKPEKMDTLPGDNGEGVIDTTAIDQIQNRQIQVQETGDSVQVGGGVTSDILTSMGYADNGLDWTEYIKSDELPPSSFKSQLNYAKDIKRFSSGANFTSVADDNGSAFFTNFIGLRRPQHVPIGDTARTVPDVDETVLARNRDFRW